jgi:hypothetical protein
VTVITGAEAAEVLWAGSEQGKAAHQAAWLKLHAMGLHQDVDATQLGQVVYAAHQAAEQACAEPEDEPLPAHLHHWAVLRAQSYTPFAMIGKPVPHTVVLTRCTQCGEPDSLMLAGEWTAEDFA